MVTESDGSPHIEQMKSLPGLYEQNPVRHEFDCALTKAAIERGLPILGVCRGHQTLNEVLGGTLLNIGNTSHLQTEPGDQPKHEIQLSRDSLLISCFNQEKVEVNSFHRQAIDRVGDGLRITALASDGVIEAVEGINQPFIVGVQFHPEYMMKDPGMARIYAQFVEAAKEYGSNTKNMNLLPFEHKLL